MASRAELRRQKKAQDKKMSKTMVLDRRADVKLQKMGIDPGVKLPAVFNTSALNSISDVANITGMDSAVLEAWARTEREKMRKEFIAEMQEKLDKIEDYLCVGNIMTSLKAMEGFRYAKAAANWMNDHYGEACKEVGTENIKEVYAQINKDWGIEMEFDVPEINQLLGIDVVDWRLQYIGTKVPVSVVDKIAGDHGVIQAVTTQLAVYWALCEGFGFHKHPGTAGSKMAKFMQIFKEKYNVIDYDQKNGIRKATDLLKAKYDVKPVWSDRIMRVMHQFDLMD